jgi:hypothetical protein
MATSIHLPPRRSAGVAGIVVALARHRRRPGTCMDVRASCRAQRGLGEFHGGSATVSNDLHNAQPMNCLRTS